MLRVRLFGPLELELDGQSLQQLRGSPARSVLAWLALHPGLHPRSRLAGQLWPDVSEERARTSLRSALTAVRRSLGDGAGGCLVASRDQIGLDGAVWIDAREFELLVREENFREAVELCRGELLPELDEEWIKEAREEHRHRLTAALGRVIASAEASGDTETAIARARERLALDPLSEDAHRELIRLLAADGDRAAALSEYERLRSRLRDELGVTPSASTRALVERLLSDAGEPRPATEAVPLPPALARHRRGPFVGRAAEVDRLRELWRQTGEGDIHLALVEGEPGIGKTRVATEFAREAHAAGATVLYGRCQEEAIAAYAPFVEALRGLAATRSLRGASGAGTRELSLLLPELSEGPPDAPAEDPEQSRYRLFEAVSSLLAAEAAARPLLLVLEDLHWADASTLLLLGYLMRAPHALLVLGTARPEELAPGHPLATLVADLRRDRSVDRVPLSGLLEEEVERLIEPEVGAQAASGLAPALERDTAGNPFFVTEAVRHLVETGGLDHAGGATLSIAELGIPEGVQDVIGRRLSRLGEQPQEVLAAAAVAGTEFELDLLARLPGRDRALVAHALDGCVRARVIREEPGRPAGSYSFAHALVRETVYQGLTATRRGGLHAEIAAALDGDDDQLATVAHHLLEAGAMADRNRAVDSATRAGRRAIERLAYEEGISLFERALDTAQDIRGYAPAQRGELLLALGDALMRAGEANPARERFHEAATLARGAGDPQLLARAALGFGGLGITLIELDQETVDLLEEALAALGDRDGDLRARLLGRLAVEHYYGADRDVSERLSDEAVAVARRSGDGAVPFALIARHVALWRPDRLSERIEIARELVAEGERRGDREAILRGQHWLAVDIFESGDIRAFERQIEIHERLADELQLPSYRWWAPMWRATLAAIDSRVDEAIGLAEEAKQLGVLAGDANAGLAAMLVEWLMVRSRRELGRASSDYVEQGVRRSATAPAFRSGRAWDHAELGELEEARRDVEWVMPGDTPRLFLDVNWLPGIAELGAACALLEDAPRAARLYELLAPYAGRHVAVGRAVGTLGAADHYLGMLAATTQRTDDAERHFSDALRLNTEIGARAWLVRGKWCLGELLGDAALLAEANSEAERLGIRPPAPSDPGPPLRSSPPLRSAPDGAGSRASRSVPS